MGLVNHYYNHRFLEEDPSLPSRNHRFEDGDIGGLVIPSSASVLAASDKKEEAEAFIQFLLSEQAQEYFAAETYEYPLAAGTCRPPRGCRRSSRCGRPTRTRRGWATSRGRRG